MTAMKRSARATPAADPLASLKVEVFAALGETSLKAECALGVAAEVAARLHVELERLVALKPSTMPRADAVPSGALYVGEDEAPSEWRRRGVGFR